MDRNFQAPWSTQLKLLTALGSAVILAVTVLLLIQAKMPLASRALLAGALLLMLPGFALFSIRGYRLEPDALIVRRLLWETSIPLRGLTRVEVRPLAKELGFRLLGNGGLFSFCGFYWSRSLGRYRLLGTDLKQAVVLRFEQRILIVTPSPPEAFAESLRQARRDQLPSFDAP